MDAGAVLIRHRELLPQNAALGLHRFLTSAAKVGALGVMARSVDEGRRRGSIYSRRRSVPFTTILMCRLPQREQTNRPR
jgi:hypothetical protein